MSEIHNSEHIWDTNRIQSSLLIQQRQTIYLLLHGKTQSDVDWGIGPRDEEILPQSRQELQQLFDEVRLGELGIARIVSSTFTSTKQTTSLVKEVLPAATVTFETALDNGNTTEAWYIEHGSSKLYTGINKVHKLPPYMSRRGISKPMSIIQSIVDSPSSSSYLVITNRETCNMILFWFSLETDIPKLEKHTLSRLIFAWWELVDIQLNATHSFL